MYYVCQNARHRRKKARAFRFVLSGQEVVANFPMKGAWIYTAINFSALCLRAAPRAEKRDIATVRARGSIMINVTIDEDKPAIAANVDRDSAESLSKRI
jgi:hypothetical protein